MDANQILKAALLSFGVECIVNSLEKTLLFEFNDSQPQQDNVRNNVKKIVTVLVKTYVMLPGPTTTQTYLIKAAGDFTKMETGFKNLQMFIVGSFVAKLKENVDFFNKE